MEQIRATIVFKRYKIRGGRFIIGIKVHDYVNVHDGTTICEVKVSEDAYNSLKVGDDVLCPMFREEEGLVFDYKYKLKKL